MNDSQRKLVVYTLYLVGAIILITLAVLRLNMTDDTSAVKTYHDDARKITCFTHAGSISCVKD